MAATDFDGYLQPHRTDRRRRGCAGPLWTMRPRNGIAPRRDRVGRRTDRTSGQKQRLGRRPWVETDARAPKLTSPLISARSTSVVRRSSALTVQRTVN